MVKVRSWFTKFKTSALYGDAPATTYIAQNYILLENGFSLIMNNRSLIELSNAQPGGANAENLANLQTGLMALAPPMLSCWGWWDNRHDAKVKIFKTSYRSCPVDPNHESWPCMNYDVPQTQFRDAEIHTSTAPVGNLILRGSLGSMTPKYHPGVSPPLLI